MKNGHLYAGILMLALAFSACGSNENSKEPDSDKVIDSGTNNDKDAADSGIKDENVDNSDENTRKELTELTPEEIIDVWYGWDEKGNLMALRISDDDADSNPNAVTVSVYPFNENYAFERYGSGYLQLFEDEAAGVKFALVGGAFSVEGQTDELYNLRFYDDNSVEYTVIETDGTKEGTKTHVAGTFYRDFPVTSIQVDAEKGMVSGIWYGEHEGERSFIIFSENGTFMLEVERYVTNGLYHYEDGILKIMALHIEDEEVAEGKYILSMTIDENCNLVPEDDSNGYAPLKAGLSETWTAEDGYTLILEESGIFRLRHKDSTGNETSGFYHVEGNQLSFISLFSGGGSYRKDFAEGTISGNKLHLVNFKDKEMSFTK